jgi:hypothetical protein
MKDSKVAFRLIDFILLNIAIIAVIAVIVFTNVNNLHKESEESGPSISKEVIQEDLKKEIENRYYYNQLDEYGRKMYNTFLSNIDKFKAGDQYINIDINKEDAGDSFQSAWDAFSVDRPEYFFIDTNKLSLLTNVKTNIFNAKEYEYKIQPKNGETYFEKEFPTKEDVEFASTQLETVTKSIIDQANERATRYDKVKFIHDFLVDNVAYSKDENEASADTIYGALINKVCVCEGYAKSFKYLLDKLEIPCIIVFGNGTNSEGKQEYHSWNYVKMDDDQWYAVDVTWDDPIIVGGGKATTAIRYKYFLVGTEIDRNHTLESDISGTGQNFKYPALSESNYSRKP